jgi:hypothetical protein
MAETKNYFGKKWVKIPGQIAVLCCTVLHSVSFLAQDMRGGTVILTFLINENAEAETDAKFILYTFMKGDVLFMIRFGCI